MDSIGGFTVLGLGDPFDSPVKLTSEVLAQLGDLREIPAPPPEGVSILPLNRMLIGKPEYPYGYCALFSAGAIAKLKERLADPDRPTSSTWYLATRDFSVIQLDESEPFQLDEEIGISLVASGEQKGKRVTLKQLIRELSSSHMVLYSAPCEDCGVRHYYAILNSECLAKAWLGARDIPDSQWAVVDRLDLIAMPIKDIVQISAQEAGLLNLKRCDPDNLPNVVETGEVIVVCFRPEIHYACLTNAAIEEMMQAEGFELPGGDGPMSVKWYLGRKVEISVSDDPFGSAIEHLLLGIKSSDKIH